MPHISSINTSFHATQDLIYSLHNPLPEIPIVKLVNGKNEALGTLSEIFIKSNPPAVPLMVPVRE